ncbi:MAG: hypothetical protein HZB70_03675 [Candidatus Berkelbacteria bacterium]|nr:MAG: hypothetical protein HZB70_03675 [Candidatus Berkelbacteria bacterium]QQG51601.1 MAG: hypothetical protein HY845_03515 [Candidatus Berkelbacteria bacterium]
MEGIIFWLVPVVLLIVFILVLLRHGRDTNKPPLLIVEPLGTLITAWQTARFIPAGVSSTEKNSTAPTSTARKQLEEYLSMFRYQTCNSGTPLEMIIISTLGIEQRSAATLLHCHGLSLWGEQRIFETKDGKILSVMMGDIGEILSKVKYNGAGKEVMSDKMRQELKALSQRSGSHGYLPVACCYRFVHARAVIEPTGHSWAGLILLEPVLAPNLIKRLRGYRQADLKMLSILPEALLSFLRRQLWRTETYDGATPSREDNPKEKEEYWDQARSIGSANLRERYSAVRYFQFGKNCRVLSGNTEDRQLPVPTTSFL